MDKSASREDMENVKPPPSTSTGPGVAQAATEMDRAELERVALVRTIAGAAARFVGECIGGDRYDNNCAHFLSDAFMRAEFVLPSYLYRCGTPSKRAIRAREMRRWFDSMAVERRRVLPEREGFWAVFQLDEDAYYGGHVVIIDTDRNRYYGTGHYPEWDQYCFKW